MFATWLFQEHLCQYRFPYPGDKLALNLIHQLNGLDSHHIHLAYEAEL